MLTFIFNVSKINGTEMQNKHVQSQKAIERNTKGISSGCHSENKISETRKLE